MVTLLLLKLAAQSVTLAKYRGRGVEQWHRAQWNRSLLGRCSAARCRAGHSTCQSVVVRPLNADGVDNISIIRPFTPIPVVVVDVVLCAGCAETESRAITAGRNAISARLFGLQRLRSYVRPSVCPLSRGDVLTELGRGHNCAIAPAAFRRKHHLAGVAACGKLLLQAAAFGGTRVQYAAECSLSLSSSCSCTYTDHWTQASLHRALCE